MKLEQLKHNQGTSLHSDIEARFKYNMEPEVDVKIKKEHLEEVSHEIHTCLKMIIRFSDMLRNQKLSPQQREEAQLVHESCDRLISQITDVLKVFKTQAKKKDTETLYYYLNALLTEIDSAKTALAHEQEMARISSTAHDQRHSPFYSFWQMDE